MKIITDDCGIWGFLYNADFSIDNIFPIIYPLYKGYNNLIDPISGEVIDYNYTSIIIELPINYWEYDLNSLSESFDCLKDNLLGIILEDNEKELFNVAMTLNKSEFQNQEDFDYWSIRIKRYKEISNYILI